MKRCMGALCLRLRSRTHSTKLLLSVVSARTRLRMPISACASAMSRTLAASGALVVLAELFWSSQKYDPPPYEPFSPLISREGAEEKFQEVRSSPCQPASSASVSMPVREKQILCFWLYCDSTKISSVRYKYKLPHILLP